MYIGKISPHHFVTSQLSFWDDLLSRRMVAAPACAEPRRPGGWAHFSQRQPGWVGHLILEWNDIHLDKVVNWPESPW